MKKIFLVTIFCFGVVNFSHANENDFDKLCHIYKTILAKNMNAHEGSQYLADEVHKIIHDKVVLQTQDAVFNLAPGERYHAVKQIAEHYLQTTWNCEPMKILLGQKAHNKRSSK